MAVRSSFSVSLYCKPEDRDRLPSDKNVVIECSGVYLKPKAK